MRQIVTILSIGVCLVGFAGCGQSDESEGLTEFNQSNGVEETGSVPTVDGPEGTGISIPGRFIPEVPGAEPEGIDPFTDVEAGMDDPVDVGNSDKSDSGRTKPEDTTVTSFWQWIGYLPKGTSNDEKPPVDEQPADSPTPGSEDEKDQNKKQTIWPGIEIPDSGTDESDQETPGSQTPGSATPGSASSNPDAGTKYAGKEIALGDASTCLYAKATSGYLVERCIDQDQQVTSDTIEVEIESATSVFDSATGETRVFIVEKREANGKSRLTQLIKGKTGKWLNLDNPEVLTQREFDFPPQAVAHANGQIFVVAQARISGANPRELLVYGYAAKQYDNPKEISVAQVASEASVVVTPDQRLEIYATVVKGIEKQLFQFESSNGTDYGAQRLGSCDDAYYPKAIHAAGLNSTYIYYQCQHNDDPNRPSGLYRFQKTTSWYEADVRLVLLSSYVSSKWDDFRLVLSNGRVFISVLDQFQKLQVFSDELKNGPDQNMSIVYTSTETLRPGLAAQFNPDTKLLEIFAVAEPMAAQYATPAYGSSSMTSPAKLERVVYYSAGDCKNSGYGYTSYQCVWAVNEVLIPIGSGMKGRLSHYFNGYIPYYLEHGNQ